MASDWDSEMFNAKGLLRCLSAEYLEEDTQRRSLLNRWPEAPVSEDSLSSSNSERFIPELLLRDDDENSLLGLGCRQSFRFLQTYIRRLVRKLRLVGEGDQHAHDGQREVVEALGKLSDRGVIEAIPGLLQKLERKQLLSICAIVSGKPSNVRNRAYLLDRMKDIFTDVHSGQNRQSLTKPMQDVVTILRYPESYKKMDLRKIELVASSAVEAAHSALLQVDQLPLKDMHVMLGTLRNSQPRKIGQPKVGGNKDRLTTNIRNIAYNLLQLEDGDKLPEPLRKSLIVMSLSARHAFGNDGKLIDFLGPIPTEKRSLHHSILSALSDINYVKNENLLLLYKDLVPDSVVSSSTKSSVMRSRIATIFLDCLLNSEIRPVPEYIRRAAGNLKGMMSQQLAVNTKFKAFTEKSFVRRHTQVELEAVLRVSSHLQQIMLDLSEYSQGSVPPAFESDFSSLTCRRRIRHSLETRSPEGAFLPVQGARASPSRSQGVVAPLDYRLDYDTGAAVSKQIQIWSLNQTFHSVSDEGDENTTETRKSCEHEFLSPAETKRLRDVSRIGDEAAQVGYMLIGCVLAEMSRLTGQRLDTSVNSYLTSGVKRKLHEAETEVEQNLRNQDQVAFILNLAESDHRISTRFTPELSADTYFPSEILRTMDRVKRRLRR